MPKVSNRKLLFVLLPAFLCAFSASALAPKVTRVALVIGNSAYKNVGPLLNPANDAKAMSQTLRKLGFDVFELKDANVAQMNTALKQALGDLKGKQGVGLFYYAGHGLQLNDQNYIIPVDANIVKVSDVPKQTLNVSAVVEAFKSAGNSMNIVVLDACRDNPFGASTDIKGLAPMDAPVGTFLAYATAPGNVAEDGDAKSGNGLYTQFLLQEIVKPQARIEDVFKRVRFQVRQKSEGRQIPWETTSLEDDFFFDDGTLIKIKPSNQEVLQQSFNEEIQLWDKIKDSKDVSDFYSFVQKYPNGTITDAAHARINFLSSTKITVQGAGADGKPLTYNQKKFRVGDEYVFSVNVKMSGSLFPNGKTESYNEVRKVAAIEGDQVSVNYSGSIYAGNLVSLTRFYNTAGASLGWQSQSKGSRYDVPQFNIPVGLMQVGAKWLIAYKGSKLFTTGEGTIAAREKVTTQGGTFDTFKVLHNTTTGDTLTKCIRWLTTDFAFPVKSECSSVSNNLTTFSSDELTRFVRGT